MGKMLTGKKVSCSKGQIKIQREGYTRKDGTKVVATEYCIDDPGKPGRTSRGAKSGPYSDESPWIQREGKLGGPGYTDKTQKERRKILDRCVKEYGYRSCLGSIMVLLRSTELHKDTRKKLEKDKKYLMDKYGGPGSFSNPEENPAEENPCCDSCAVGNPCESGCPSHEPHHPHGCPCPRCRAYYMNNPAPEVRKLKSKLLR